MQRDRRVIVIDTQELALAHHQRLARHQAYENLPHLLTFLSYNSTSTSFYSARLATMYNGLPRICRAPRHALQLTRPAAARTAQTQSSIVLRRSLQTTQKFAKKRKSPTHATATTASTPPPHTSSPSSSFPRTRKWARRLAWTSAVLGGIYMADTQWNNAAVTRSMRTFKTGLVIGLDYKINFRADPPFAESLAEVHNRNAERVFNLLRENGGLYLKIGQAIAMQSAILPPEFQKMFARMFDDAPQNGWEDVERVVREDFGGKGPEEVFGVSFTGEEGKGVMERTARASASVAQVHWARLPDGREIAVKIQKREIAAQVGWDLWAFKYDSYCLTPSLDRCYADGSY